MILHPGILALLVSSLLISGMVLYSAACGIGILRGWDISSGSERQLLLERKTYLISTILGYFLAFQLISLFLFVYTTDSICPLFVGAMCAVGTLSLNAFGYPVLFCKTANFFLAGLWLILNHVDSRGYDYPLLKIKYWLLLFMAPFVLTEAVLQGLYFISLVPDVITSCCGSLFGTGEAGLASEMAALPPFPMMAAFYSAIAITVLCGSWFYRTGKAGPLFALMNGTSFIISIISIISFISLYFYELPTHHCPFCIMQREYGFIGYPLYLLLLVGTVTGLGSGLLSPFRKIPSLAPTLPALQKWLALLSMLCWLIFAVIATWPILFSSFSLKG